MFTDISQQLIETNRSKMELERLTEDSAFVVHSEENESESGCSC